jgi:hypothetical protein
MVITLSKIPIKFFNGVNALFLYARSAYTVRRSSKVIENLLDADRRISIHNHIVIV